MTLLWIKALHVISVIAWMAGMLYLPRLFVYHAQATPGSEMSETFKVMERRLLRAIINPAMTATFIFGISMLVLEPALLREPWLHVKLLLVLCLGALHGKFSKWRREFAEDRNKTPARTFKIMNELVTLAMIGIVILVIVRPF
ncbi:protoporphyrinogen oxidase HemJ [Roseiterribacter gracilis]|uniref:Protoporphyrinogen IX oxidase n=1 Tax=Roseiterribacter gracilis TaxID=2812848 RepID=A0A8S8XFP9_9PROT|nr:membrane protein [Rhodospirillales bacterium TMPK1]